jgi:polyphosphate kinase
MADKSKDKKKAEAPESSGPLPDMSAPPGEKSGHHKKMDREVYEAELEKLQVELVKLQEWIKHAGLRVAVIFEGRDAAGKGGTIKRVTEHLNPRVVRIAALATPTERERTEWYFQRYVEHLPAAGEMVCFDRSWYNRPGVERVMGFCSEDEVWEFFRTCPEFERMLIRSGIILLKYWFSVSDEEQEKRFQARLKDPLKVWKLSPMDLESRMRWLEYSQAKDEMFAYTDTKDSPWWVVNADDKRRARLNMIHHLLSQIPYQDVTHHDLKLADRPAEKGYVRPPVDSQTFVPEAF